MEKTIYLIDNMVICSKAIAPYLEKDFIQYNVWIIDEVIYEARKSRRIDTIKKLRHNIEANECERLKHIVINCVEKYKILKLYEGCADAILIATALAINDSDSEQGKLQFEYNTPIIVTQEKGIRDACESTGIQWLSQSGFIQIAKQSYNAELPLKV